MEIKSSPVSHERSVEASQRSDSRADQREAEFSSREVARSEQDREATQSAAQGSEARFFALESREETQPDPRLQVRATRERVRQTYAEQENRDAQRVMHEQQAQSVRDGERDQGHEGRQPIDLIA